MLEQTLIDTLIVLGMFVLRIGVPLGLAVLIGKWLEKKLSPEEQLRKIEGLPKSAHIIPFRARHNTIPSPSITEDAVEKRTSIK